MDLSIEFKISLSNGLGVLCRFFLVIYREMPIDSLLTQFPTQLVHSKKNRYSSFFTPGHEPPLYF